ncbi:pol-like protein [Purpureocillium lavendulum]|uniref:Pol-like protein n=1 Tax=Purpureocillium lavendulum TaxID=1247861 RepID=A0AB34FLB7_9HYPO|nr:pol-like protein [Purpureocillium lavendulum]
MSDLAVDSSPIVLCIDTSIKVTNNNNIVCIRDTPADNAKEIVEAVVKAMRDYSAGNIGLPMIDDDGRPRPIEIKIHAGIMLEGSTNFVGGKETLNQYLKQKIAWLRIQRGQGAST